MTRFASLRLDLFAAVAVLACVFGCSESKDEFRPAHEASTNGLAVSSSGTDLALIRGIGPKIGEAGSVDDPVVRRILAAGTNATPFLLEMLTNDSPSQVYDVFQYYIGDIAHRLLCDIYGQQFLWPVAGATPVGGYPEVTFQDYMVFVHAQGGRTKLQSLWRERLKTIPAKPGN